MVFSEQRALQIGADEIVRQGRAIYEGKLRAILDTPENLGRFLSIDIDSGDYAVGGRLDAAETMLRTRPDAVICTLKIGYAATVTTAGLLLPSSVHPGYTANFWVTTAGLLLPSPQ